MQKQTLESQVQQAKSALAQAQQQLREQQWAHKEQMQQLTAEVRAMLGWGKGKGHVSPAMSAAA